MFPTDTPLLQYIPPNIGSGNIVQRPTSRRIGRYKTFFHLEAFVHKSIILVLPLITCIAHTIAILLHDYCAIYDPPPDPPCISHTPYNIGNDNIV